MECNSCEYCTFCKDSVSSISCGEIRKKLKGQKVSTLKEFCDLAIKSERGYEKCCRWCVEEFVTQDCTEQFCSEKCKNEYMEYKTKGEILPKTEKLEKCLNCGEPLIFGDKFCSKTCRGEYEYHREKKKGKIVC